MSENNLSTSGACGPNLWSGFGFQVGVYVDASFNVMFCKRVPGINRTGAWSKFDMGDVTATIPGGGTTVNPLKSPAGNDGHETPCIAIDGDGYVHIGRMLHFITIGPRPLLVRSTKKINDPTFSMSAWVDESEDLMRGIANETHEYMQFAAFSDGELLLRHDSRIINASNDQASACMFYIRKLGATNWTLQRILARGTPDPNTTPPETVTEDAFYTTLPFIDSNDRVHVFGVWTRDHHGQGNILGREQFPSYCRSDDRGLTWSNINGTVLTLPLTRWGASGQAARIGIDFGILTNGHAYSLTVDGAGNPYATLPARPTGGGAPGGIHIIRRGGGTWIDDDEFCAGGGSGMRYGAGQALQLVWFQNDLFAFARRNTNAELRRVAAPRETINVASNIAPPPNYSALPNQSGSQRYCWNDPIVLRDLGFIELLTTDYDIPKTPSFGRFAANATHRPVATGAGFGVGSFGTTSFGG